MEYIFYSALVIALSVYLSVDRHCNMRERIDDNQYEENNENE